MAASVGTATIAQLTTENRTFYELKLLRVATGPFLHSWFAQEGGVFPSFQLPENAGDTIQWSKPTALTAVTTSLTEAVTPEPMDITINVITTTVSEYGAYIRYSRKLAMMGKLFAHVKSSLINLGKAVMPTHNKQAFAYA